MNTSLRRAFFCTCLILCMLDSSLAKEWRGIVPLHSTRDDVRKLLGKPLFDENRPSDIYDVEEGRANIIYIRQRCEQGLPANWGNWNVAPGTVANITIYLKEGIPLSELKIPDIEKYKWYTDDSGATYYQLKKEGIEYQVQDGKVTGVTYGATEDDEKLLCKKKAPVIRY